MKHLLIAFVLCTLFVLVLAQNPSYLETTYGPVQGYVSPDNVRTFKGIPFAKPPVGALRFQSPQAPDSWSDVLPVFEYAPGCAQECDLPPGVCPEQTSEDCLYLNVWAPLETAEPDTEPLPIMVFIPGGRFLQGTGGTDLYSGERIANRTRTIVVTISYRLGVLGFLSVSSGVVPPNLGIADQRLALQWVQDNAKAFGGDPSRVTLFGESAGGSSTAYHLVSPLSAGLFSRAIIESNPWTIRMRTVQDFASSVGTKFLSKLGCDAKDLSCMQSKAVADILAAQDATNVIPYTHLLEYFMEFQPMIDGSDVTDQSIFLFQAGKWNKMPVVLGNVAQEAVMFVDSITNKTINGIEFDSIMTAMFGLSAPKAIQLYNGPDHLSELSRVGTDYLFACPARYVANAIAKSGQSAYVYHFNHIMSFEKGAWGPDYTYCIGYVCHGSEIPFVFDSAWLSGFTMTAEERTLTASMLGWWTDFAHGKLDSTQHQGLSWPAFDSSNKYDMLFATPSDSIESDPQATVCNFWDSTSYRF